MLKGQQSGERYVAAPNRKRNWVVTARPEN
jgi:hypothetical protein